MKRTITAILAIVMMALSLSAQEKVGTYTMSHKTRDVLASNDTKLSVYLDILGDTSYDRVMLNIDGEDNIREFQRALIEAKAKYKEWVKVAKDNKVSSVYKQFPIEFPRATVCWFTSKWHFDFRRAVEPNFSVLKLSSGEISYNFAVSGTAKASDNEYIDMKYYIFLDSEAEFDSMIKALDADKLLEQFNKKADLDDLFQ